MSFTNVKTLEVFFIEAFCIWLIFIRLAASNFQGLNQTILLQDCALRVFVLRVILKKIDTPAHTYCPHSVTVNGRFSGKTFSIADKDVGMILGKPCTPLFHKWTFFGGAFSFLKHNDTEV